MLRIPGRSAFNTSLHIGALLHLDNWQLHPVWPSQLSIIQFLLLCKHSGTPNSFHVWLCCIWFMHSTHEQTVHCQNKCSYSGCVSWGVCTEISLMIISLGKHVDILEAVSSSVSVLYLFFLKKLQHIVNSFTPVVESLSSAVCNGVCLRVSAHAIGCSQSVMCVYMRCLAPQLRSVGYWASVAPFLQSAAWDKVLA